MAMQGSVVGWVAGHRRHHAYADKEGDPHSPWLFGTSVAALAKGFWHAHIGWMFEHEKTNASRFAPDLLADCDIQRVDRLFPVLLGQPGPRRPAAPRHMVCELHLPHDR